MKLEVGMYVRTKRGNIAKIIEEIKDGRRKEFVLDRLVTLNNRCTEIIRRTDKVTSSHNIIEIIQSKDLIVDTKNNLYVVDRVEGDYVFTTSKNEYGLIITLVDYQIKSVLTKEQFAAMQYEVE